LTPAPAARRASISFAVAARSWPVSGSFTTIIRGAAFPALSAAGAAAFGSFGSFGSSAKAADDRNIDPDTTTTPKAVFIPMTSCTPQ